MTCEKLTLLMFKAMTMAFIPSTPGFTLIGLG